MASTPVPSSASVAPRGVAAACAQVPDPRRAASVGDPLPAILALAVAAILAHHLSGLAIAEWGARQEATMLAALGFAEGRPPCQSTGPRLFRQLDGDAVAAALTEKLPAAGRPGGERGAGGGPGWESAAGTAALGTGRAVPCMP